MKHVEDVVAIPLEKLVPHPDNPRPRERMTKESLKPLSKALEENGTTPLIVREIEDGKYQVVAGHRRLAALTVAGEKTAPCVVREMEDVRALKALLGDNALHEDPDPFLEARVIRKLLDEPGATLENVATSLGWSVRRVARRRELMNLCPTILEAHHDPKNEVSRWPITWLEVIVQLDTVAQELWWKNERPQWFRSIEDVERSVQTYLRVLGKAPWDLDDAALYPKAGACSVCPKQSMATPGLFGNETPGPESLAKATCRDAPCWKIKLDRHAARTVSEALAKDDKLVCLKGERSGYEPGGARLARATARAPKGRTVIEGYAWTPCAKDDKGAKQGIVISGPGAGTKRWFKRTGQSSRHSYSSRPAPVPLKEQLQRAEGQFENLCKTSLAGALRARLEEIDAKGGPPTPPAAAIADLCAIFGFGGVVHAVRGVMREGRPEEAFEDALQASRKDWLAGPDRWFAERWPEPKDGNRAASVLTCAVDEVLDPWNWRLPVYRRAVELVCAAVLNESELDAEKWIDTVLAGIVVPAELLELRERAKTNEEKGSSPKKAKGTKAKKAKPAAAAKDSE